MSDRAPRRRWYKHRESSGADAALFFIVFLTGAAGIAWLKEEGYHQFVVTAVPVALLVLYAGAVGLVPRFRLREDQAGDNCYYLGFLFTLVSLSFALAAFVRAGGTEEIVEDFGIALVSTILGLALRVGFNQMRQEPVDVEREARIELADAARRLRAELDQSVIELNTFRRSTQQSIADGLEEFNTKVADLLKASLAHYDEVTRGSAERIETTLAAFAEHARELHRQAEKTAAAIEALTERIEAIKAPENLIEEKLGPAAGAVEEMVRELRERARAESEVLQELRKLIESAGSASEGLEAKVTSVGEAADHVVRFADHVARAQEKLGLLTERLVEAGGTLSAGSAEWRETLGAEINRMARMLDEAVKVVAAACDELTGSLAKPAREAGTVIADIAAHTEKLRDLEAQLNRLSPLLKEQVALSRPQKRGSALRRIFGFR